MVLKCRVCENAVRILPCALFLGLVRRIRSMIMMGTFYFCLENKA